MSDHEKAMAVLVARPGKDTAYPPCKTERPAIGGA